VVLGLGGEGKRRRIGGKRREKEHISSQKGGRKSIYLLKKEGERAYIDMSSITGSH